MVIVTTITRAQKLMKTLLWISHFICLPILVISSGVLAISPLMFSCGNGTVGTSQAMKSHNGFHPCFTSYTKSFLAGMIDLTRWLWIRYRFLKTYVDLGLYEPTVAFPFYVLLRRQHGCHVFDCSAESFVYTCYTEVFPACRLPLWCLCFYWWIYKFSEFYSN